MTTADDYISQVIARMPSATPQRSQIALELQGTIAERTAHGQSIDEVIRQLGDPAALADSYLAAVPLVAASFWSRVAAKLVDFVVVVAPGAVPLIITRLLFGEPRPGLQFFPLVLVGMLLLSPFYTILSEYWASCTLGKWLMGLRVVRESGARIGFGQAVVRQLAAVAGVFVIDSLFALFTEKHQRAFELLSKTRVVQVGK
jgi:uncharacterized RDD family membrane protein YckC